MKRFRRLRQRRRISHSSNRDERAGARVRRAGEIASSAVIRQRVFGSLSLARRDAIALRKCRVARPLVQALTSARRLEMSRTSFSKNGVPSPIRIGGIEFRTSSGSPRRGDYRCATPSATRKRPLCGKQFVAVNVNRGSLWRSLHSDPLQSFRPSASRAARQPLRSVPAEPRTHGLACISVVQPSACSRRYRPM